MLYFPMTRHWDFLSGPTGLADIAVLGCINIVSTLLASLLVDRAGRTLLLRWSSAGMAVCSVILALVGNSCFPELRCDRDSKMLYVFLCHDDTVAHVCGDWARWTAILSIC